MSFADRLIDSARQKRSRVVVGLDPHLELLPPALLADVDMSDRNALASLAERFCLGIIDVVSDIVPAVKPQVAFFERLGAAGYQALEAVVAAARERSLVVISDGKRSDIGSTAAAYADYHLGSEHSDGRHPLGLGADAMTVNPYLGEDSLEPFIQYLSRGKGLFVLAKTSNKGSGDFQDRILEGANCPLFNAVATLAQSVAARFPLGNRGYSSIGLVVGATFPDQAIQLRAAFPSLLFLIPGVGAQGAKPDDIRDCFGSDGYGAIVNASRSVIFAYRDARTPDRWQEAARAAAILLRDELNSAIEA